MRKGSSQEKILQKLRFEDVCFENNPGSKDILSGEAMYFIVFLETLLIRGENNTKTMVSCRLNSIV